jgi:hypothetical protein
LEKTSRKLRNRTTKRDLRERPGKSTTPEKARKTQQAGMETIGKRREGKKVGGGEKKAMKNGNLRFDETTGPVFLERAKPSETNQTRETRGKTQDQRG